jgi:hypothetical protein
MIKWDSIFDFGILFPFAREAPEVYSGAGAYYISVINTLSSIMQQFTVGSPPFIG